MFVKSFLLKRVLIFILFVFLGLIAPLGVQVLSASDGSLRTGEASSQLLLSHPQSLIVQGKELYEAGQYSEAARIWQQTTDAFAAQGDREMQALALSHLSLTYQRLGEWNRAKEAISSSLSLLNNSGGSAFILAQVLNAQGRLQLSLGQAEDALATLKQATNAYRKAGDEAGITGSLINQTQAMQSLGYYRQATKTLEELEKNLLNQTDSTIKVMGLLSLGNTLRVVGDLAKSEQVLQQSLQVAERLQSPHAIASAQLSLGNTKRALASKTEDLSTTEPASETQTVVSLYQQAAQVSPTSNTRIQALVNQLSLLMETQQWSAAQALFPVIQKELNNLPPNRTAIYAQVNLAHSWLASRQDKKLESASNIPVFQRSDVATLLATAAQQANNLGDKRAESYALGTLGQLYEVTEQWSNAQELTNQALVLSQAMNASDIAYRWQWQLGRLLKAQGDIPGAIAAYTEAVNTLKSLRSDLVAINPEVQFSFRESVEPVYRQLVGLLLRSPLAVREARSQDGVKVSEKNIIQARGVIESLQLAELDNFFQEACLDANPVLIDQVAQQAEAGVIYPIILEDSLEVILSLPQQPLRHYATAIPQSQVETNLEQLQQDLGRPSSSYREVLRRSQQVYDWLIRPAETEIKNSGVGTLVFVLDGALRNIPMSVLHDGNQYLMEQYNLALTPGLQLLDPKPLSQVQLRALTGGLSESRDGFAPLPGVESELQQITAEVQNSTVLLNQQFTSTTLQQQINAAPFPVVHLATHGKFSSNAEDTFLLAWDRRINVKDLDEFLRVRNQGQGRAIELLVLSACETASGDKRAALGLAGMAVRAGARSTLATLWPVKDVATAKLMTQFYQELGTKGKAEALRTAQLALAKNFKHPYYWAPYVLVGNWL